MLLLASSDADYPYKPTPIIFKDRYDCNARNVTLSAIYARLQLARINDYKLLEDTNQAEISFRTTNDLCRYIIASKPGETVFAVIVQNDPDSDYRKLKRAHRQLTEIWKQERGIQFTLGRQEQFITASAFNKSAFFKFSEWTEYSPLFSPNKRSKDNVRQLVLNVFLT